MEGDLFDYLVWRGDLTFRAAPLCEADALLLAELSYLHFPFAKDCVMTVSEAFEAWKLLPDEERFSGLGLVKDKTGLLLEHAAKSKRFGHVRLTRYSEVEDIENEEQFAAVTFLLPGQILFIAYRGTGDTLIGWKEDFNMVFMDKVPSQEEAARYAEDIAALYPDYRLILGGQSKGGNLAVWAAANLQTKTKQRLKTVYNLDGPGFIGGFTKKPAYREIEKRIRSYVPASSLVGVLMGECTYTIIKSTTLSVLQHNPFTWMICGTAFTQEAERTKSSRVIEQFVDGMLINMSRKDRADFVEKLFSDLTAYSAKTVADLKKHLFSTIVKVLLDLKQFSDKSKENKARRQELMAALKEMTGTMR